tara:strand:- start:539 stop:2695 length:2157 start_codon:yes stop_codon:yes gene_type:complete
MFNHKLIKKNNKFSNYNKIKIDSLPKKDTITKLFDISKDSLKLVEKKILQEKKKKKKKKKNLNPLLFKVKPIDSVTVFDYKIMYLNGNEKSVDTSLTIFKDYFFNFLREDYFELLPFPNMGEGFNKLGYNFHDGKITPDLGARVKHFGYFEVDDVPYYNVPSPFTELFFKSTFDQGHHLDALVTLNTSPRFNFSIAYRGFRSLGSYAYSKSTASQFRFSSQYDSYDKKYRLRLHLTSQKLGNDVNGGLTNDSVYFFENSPNFAIVNPETGEVEVDENGETLYENYGGFMDRTRLRTQIVAENTLSGKRYFTEQVYFLSYDINDISENFFKIGHIFNYETKFYRFSQVRKDEYFSESFIEKGISDRSNFKTIENNLFLEYNKPFIGNLKLNFKQITWNYFFENDDYIEEDRIDQKINENQFSNDLIWRRNILGFDLKARMYYSYKEKYSSNYYMLNVSKKLLKNFNVLTKYQFRSTPPNFNFNLYQSDYIGYNWKNFDLENQSFSTLSIKFEHLKWGYFTGEWNKLNKYVYFLNVTPLSFKNERMDILPTQQQEEIEYFKIKFFQNLEFGKFSFVNTVQYQKVNQVDDPNLSFTPLALNVPEWLTRNTIAYSTDLFNKALYIQTGFSFKFFTDYYADQYNPLIGEFVTQNNVKIGEYPLVDFFLNAKIQQTRVFLKIENLSGKIEHIINEDTKYDYYAAPYTPYRDFSIRFGLVWNFFQ